MTADDFTYCKGNGCRIRSTCLRYTEGKLLKEGLHWWMKSCDHENKELYINNKKA